MIIFIVGLPGSGKTQLLRRFEHLRATIIDDITVQRATKIQGPHQELIVITDPNACKSDPDTVRYMLTIWFGDKHHIAFLAFENDPDQCWKNIQNRDDARIISREYVYRLSAKYDPQQWSSAILSVWRPA